MFKVGDILTGTEDNEYGVTNSKATVEVVEILDNSRIRVKLLTHLSVYEQLHTIGGCFNVEIEYFKLVKAKDSLSSVERKIAFMYKRFAGRNAA